MLWSSSGHRHAYARRFPPGHERSDNQSRYRERHFGGGQHGAALPFGDPARCRLPDEERARRDGLEPEEVYRWSKPLQRLKPPFFSLVSMPTWLGGKHKPDDPSIYRKKLLSDPEKARFILDSVLNSLRRTLHRLKPVEGKNSVWSDYMTVNNNYTADHFQAKQRFVGEALNEFPSRSVLDVGCNTGHFSAIAARSGARVVALDYDPVVLGTVWRQARAEKLDILPLADIIDLAAELTTNLLIIECVAPDDSMFQRLTRGREELHQDLTSELFENLCRRHFEIVRVQHVEGATRWLYLLRKRSSLNPICDTTF